MRNLVHKLALPAIALAAMAWTAGSAQAQLTGIAATPHNLAAGGADNSEICVYCHTPHGSNVNVEAPLWNKPNNTTTYQTYDSTTIDGQVLAVGSVSLACLTCHDGTQAMDTVINAPGSGGFVPAGASLGTSGKMTSPIANLTTDLTNDHPIGIQYGGFDPGGGVIDPDFLDAADTPGLQVATISGKQRWWVDTSVGTAAVREKSDMILYTRNDPGDPAAVPPIPAGPDQPFVECASCHDPHESTNVPFLRISNSGSSVCLACHVK